MFEPRIARVTGGIQRLGVAAKSRHAKGCLSVVTTIPATEETIQFTKRSSLSHFIKEVGHPAACKTAVVGVAPFGDSIWMLPIVPVQQSHFAGQPMADYTGEAMQKDLCGHLNFHGDNMSAVTMHLFKPTGNARAPLAKAPCFYSHSIVPGGFEVTS